ncbi:hypothetical protein [Pelomonas sp. Root1444]|uniref:hypothetical protein n=1 Tax=Pelomonas sp. Root1444 TaxID=1736464 RepID=UPI000B239852|nr:hypothetical protein [Pelomonas sp. Root1444]
MATDHIQPMPGRRPVYPVDADDGGQADAKTRRPGKSTQAEPPDQADDPASDENTESANHPNDE